MAESTTQWVLSLATSPWVFVGLIVVLALGGTLTFLPSQSLVVALTTISFTQSDPLLATALLLTASVIGMVIGDLGSYALARWIEPSRWVWLNGPRVGRTRGWMRRQLRARPRMTMVTARLIPMGRLTTSLACGDLRMPPATFIGLSAIGSTVWAVYSVSIGAFAGIWVEKHPVLVVAIAVAVALMLGAVASWVQAKLVSSDEPQAADTWPTPRGSVSPPR